MPAFPNSLATRADKAGSEAMLGAETTAPDGFAQVQPWATDSAQAGLVAILRTAAGMPDEAIARARLVESETGETLDKIVTRLGLISEDALAGALAKALGLPLIDAAGLPSENPDLPDISAAFLRDRRALPLRREGARLIVAMANPLDRDAVDGIDRKSVV